jgi:hypothetical protein
MHCKGNFLQAFSVTALLLHDCKTFYDRELCHARAFQALVKDAQALSRTPAST